MTGDTGPPFIISASLSSNNSYNTSFSKPGDNITLKFVANERLSETSGVDALNKPHPKNSPKVDFWVNNNTSYQTVDAIKDTSDLSGRTWKASLVIQNSQVPWNDNTSEAGDIISYKIYEYWDLAKDANLNFVPNLGSDNYTSTTDGSYIIYDNVLPTLKSPLKSLLNLRTVVCGCFNVSLRERSVFSDDSNWRKDALKNLLESFRFTPSPNLLITRRVVLSVLYTCVCAYPIVRLWSLDLVIFDLKFGFYASKSSPWTTPEVWKPAVCSPQKNRSEQK